MDFRKREVFSCSGVLFFDFFLDPRYSTVCVLWMMRHSQHYAVAPYTVGIRRLRENGTTDIRMYVAVYEITMV